MSSPIKPLPWFLLTLLPFAVGCGDDDPSDPSGSGGAGASSTGGSGGDGGSAPLSCELSVTAPEALVSEGGRAILTVSAGADVTDLVATGDGVEWSELATDDATSLLVRLGYGVSDSVALTVTGACGDEPVTAEATLGVKAINWETTPSWDPGTTGPIGREYGTMWIDANDPDRLNVWGGFHYQPEQFTPGNDYWQYDFTSETWTELVATDAPLLPGGGLAIGADGVPVHFGGLIADNAINPTPPSLYRITEAATAPTFELVTPSETTPAGDYQPGFVYDAPRDRFVTACGLNGSWGQHCHARAYYPADQRWEVLLPAEGDKPIGRNGQFFVYDEENERLIIFSGDMGGGAGGSCNCAHDTWALELSEDPVRWVLLDDGASAQLGRRNGAFAYDPMHQRMLIWGGTPDGATTFPGLYALDLQRGHEGWTLVEPGGATPPERSSGRAVYDGPRERMLFGFGNGAGGVHEDLWSLSL